MVIFQMDSVDLDQSTWDLIFLSRIETVNETNSQPAYENNGFESMEYVLG